MVSIALDSCVLPMTVNSTHAFLPRKSVQNVQFSRAPMEGLGFQSSFLGRKLFVDKALSVQSSLALVCNAYQLIFCKQLVLQLQDRRVNRHVYSSTSNGAVRASMASDLFKRFIRCLLKTPARIFLKDLEDEVDKAANVIEEGAEIVKDIAGKVEYVAEEAEIIAKEAEKLATTVDQTTINIEKEVDDALQLEVDIKQKSLDSITYGESKGS